MTAAVDTNVLLDILLGDSEHFSGSKKMLERFAAKGAVIISPVVYTELLTQFIRKFSLSAQIELDAFLRNAGLRLTDFSPKDFFIAAEAWQNFDKKEVQCPKCGQKNVFSCKRCRQTVKWRNHVVTDFLVGAHAKNQAGIFLTRDVAFYRKYFGVNAVDE